VKIAGRVFFPPLLPKFPARHPFSGNMNSPLRRLLTILAAWGLAAVAAGALRLMLHVPPFMVPLLIGGLTAALAAAAFGSGWMAGAVRSIGTRAILRVHLLRFIGFYFLLLHAHGRLPREFAERAGWGDVIAAAGAFILLLVPPGAGFSRSLAVWNWIGLIDLVVAVGTAGWLNIARPGSMSELAGLPLALVPLWIVPILLASHLVLFRRIGAEKPGD